MELQEKISNYLSTLNEASCGCDSNCSCGGNCGSNCNCKPNCEPVNESVQEDKTDSMKRDKLNDIFQALEQLNSEYDELATMDMNYDSTGAGDLTDQLTTMRKHIEALYKVLDRSSAIVPMEQTEDNDALQKKLGDLYGPKQGEPKFVYFNAEDGKVKMQVDNRVVVHSADPKDIAQAMADHGVSNQDRMAHSSDVDFADEEGFANSGDAHEIIDQALELAGLAESTVEAGEGRDHSQPRKDGERVPPKAQAYRDRIAKITGTKDKNTPVRDDINRLRQLAGV